MKKRRCLDALCGPVLVLTLLCGPARPSESDWPCWRGPNHDGKSPDTGVQKHWPEGGPRLLWRVPGLGAGFSSPSVAGDRVFVTGELQGDLVASSLTLDGRILWKKRIDAACTASPAGARGTPAVEANHIYVLSGNGLLVCLDAENGTQLWTRHMRDFNGKPGRWGYCESVLVFHNMVIAKPGGPQCIVALDTRDGGTVWVSSGLDAGPDYSSCIPIDFEHHSLILAGTRSGLICVNAADGTMAWKNGWSTNNIANCPTPVYANGHVFWVTGFGRGGICLRLRTVDQHIAADVAWTTKDLICDHGGCIIHDGYIYGSHVRGWSCLDLASGRLVWHDKSADRGSMCFADGMLFLFGERDGQLSLAPCSPDGLRVTGALKVEGTGPSWAHPVVIGRRLYLRYDENLYCYDLADHRSSLEE